MPQWTVKLSISMSGGTAGSVTVRSRIVSPDPRTVTAGNRSTLKASSSTRLSRRSSRVATTSLRSGSVREPSAAAIVNPTSVTTTATASQAATLSFMDSFWLRANTGSGLKAQARAFRSQSRD